MTTVEENELITRVGPGTPMGELMRQYWTPALLSSELPEANGAPVRVKLLGEELIAFRDSQGKVGLVAQSCPHRGASLFFGRNEEDGLRCVYHGWKFDTTGACVDMPSEPAESNFKHKVKAIAYPCQERNGMVWAYLGPRETSPPLPQLEGNLLPEGTWNMVAVQRECNWLQALEGDIDTAHLGFLHHGTIPASVAAPGTFSFYELNDRAPRYQVVETDYGTMYGAYRPATEDSYYWRIAHFLLPFYTMPPVGLLGIKITARCWVPIDDAHTIFFMMSPKLRPAPEAQLAAQSDASPTAAFGPTRLLPNSTDWYGRFRPEPNRVNDYQIDREAQRRGESYTGVRGIHMQDQTITESMGPIYNRSKEHLGSTDTMIIKTRQRLLNAAKDLRDQGITPPGVDDPSIYAVRAGGVILPRDEDWVEATQDLRAGFVEHAELDVEIVGNIPGA
jgi:phthalate 4,5-dioxygenase